MKRLIICLMVICLCFAVGEELSTQQHEINALETELTREHIQMLELTSPEVIQARTIDKCLGQPYGPDNYIKLPHMAPED